MSEELVEVGDARLFTTRSGAGEPLILCSGGPGFGDYLAPVAAMLDDLLEVMRFEQRGCGRSAPAGPYDLETCVADLEALRAHWGFERWWVGGHSWGADLALVYALEHPSRVHGVLSLAAHGPHDDRSWSAAYHAELERRGETVPDDLPEPNREVNRVGNASYRAFLRSASLWRRIAALDLPVLVVAAGRDVRPSWPLEQLAEALPRGRFERIEGAEHFLWLTHADELGALLRDFVR